MNNTICVLLLLSCVIFFQVEGADDKCCTTTAPPASKLKKNILCGYDRTERPVKLRTSTVTVHIQMFLKHFFLHEEYNELEIHAWMMWQWVDEFLSWVPSEHDGVKTLHIDHSEIWVPNVYQFTSSNTDYITKSVEDGSCLLEFNGKVTCVPESMYLVICSADLTKWPFDTHNCTMKMGSLWYNGDQLDLINEPNTTLSEFHANRDWELLTLKSFKEIHVYKNATYPFVNFNFVLKRHAGGHTATVLVPALVMTLLTLVSFWMEPLGSNRFTVCCINVLVHCLYLQYLGSMLPSNGDSPPIIVLFYRDSLLLAGFSLLAAALVRGLTAASGVAPTWTTNSLNWILGSKPGQLLIQREPSSTKEEAITTEGSSAEEGAELVASSQIKPAVKWNIIAVLLDRITFIVFLLTYFVFILAFIP